MERSLPGVHFIDAFDEDKKPENGVAFGNSSAPSVTTTPLITSVLPSTVFNSAPVTTPIISIATPRVESAAEPQQFFRQPLSSIVPGMSVNQHIKKDLTSTEPSMSASAAPPAGQSLVDFLDKFDSYKPTIPENTVHHYMRSAGLSTSDPKVTQLIALASQKFISDIVNDAYHFSQTQKCKKTSEKPTLTLEVLTPVLAEYGITLRKPPYLQ